MKLIFSIIMAGFIFTSQNFTMDKKDKETFKKRAFFCINHVYKNLTYNRKAESLDYKKLLEEKPYLSDNIYTEKYPEYELEPDNEKNTIFRLFTDKKNSTVLFFCKEDIANSKRYFIDNKNDNSFYLLDDTNEKAYRYLKENISYDDQENIKGFIDWADDLIEYFNEIVGMSVDPVLFDKVKNFGVLDE